MLEMGKLSGADIEPPEQTRLLNSCVCNAGVIGGGFFGGVVGVGIWLCLRLRFRVVVLGAVW